MALKVGQTQLVFSPDNSFGIVKLPDGARILNLSLDGGRLYLWWLGDPDATREKRYFQSIFGDMTVTEGSRYIESIRGHDGQGRDVTFHIFEVDAAVYLNWMLLAQADTGGVVA